ncbi:MAG TPA: 50S ribosomal protein L24 [Anaerolineae bacterium]|nr:50S ribosomal protein L24 [Anaerolineae bacterium]
MNRIKKGDIVEVIAGDDKGMRGEVLRVLIKENRVVVSKVNIITKHQNAQRAGRSQMQGGRIRFEAPIHISNVMLVSPKDNLPTRVGFKVVDGRKVRISRRTGDVID